MDIELIVLGSGQDGGSPQFGAGAGMAGERTASSIVVAGGGVTLLFDAGPDLRQQWSSLRAMRPDGPPLPTAVFLTHAHVGHYAGLVHFGTEVAATNGIPLYAPASVLRFLAANEPWRMMLTEGRLIGHAIDDRPARFGALRIEGITVPHREDFAATVAYSIAIDDVPWALYLPDIDDWAAWPAAEATVAAHRVALLDATFSSSDEVAGRDIETIPHPLVPDTIERFSNLTEDRRILLTHINHTNRLGAPGSAIRRQAEDAGFEVAHDGMVVAP